MKVARFPLLSCAASLSLMLALNTLLHAQEAVPRDVQDIRTAEALMAQQKYEEALKFYEGVPQNYPSSALIPGANLGAAICHYFLKNYDKAVEAAERNTKGTKPGPPEVMERSFLIVPQIHLAKTSTLAPDDPLRTKAFMDAIQGFDDFVKRFPQSEEVEAANYGKGRAQFQIDQYDAAAESFRANVMRFANSPSALDSQFMLALVLGAKAVKTLETATANDPTIVATFDEAEKLLRQIIDKRSDLALMNGATFQLGELLSARSAITPKEGGAQETMLKRALEAYRYVAPKEVVIDAQQKRIAYFEELARQSGTKGDVAGLRRNRRQAEKEQEKLADLKSLADQSIAAKIKSGQIILGLGKYDEARVLLRFAEGFLDDSEEAKDQKRLISYFITVTYAAQHVVDKAEASYAKFRADYKDDPISENLELLMGGMYLSNDPKINNPDKAIEYFDKQVSTFPDSRFAAEAAMQKASALIQLRRFDEALASLQKFINSTTDKSLAAQAEFNLAVIHSEQDKLDEAAAAFKNVRDKYADTDQAEQAAFRYAQVLYQKGDAKGALEEFNSFMSKHPKSEIVSMAAYFKARALGAMGKAEESLEAYKMVAEEHPQSEVAIPSFFERAVTLQTSGQLDEAITVMRAFIEKYPDAPNVYAAHDFIAQIQLAQGKSMEAIKTYEEYIEKYPDNPTVTRAHVAIAGVWEKEAKALGTYLSLGRNDQPKWAEYMDNATASAQAGIEKHPEADAVSSALQMLLGIEQVRMAVNLKKPEEVESYFTSLADKFESKSTKSKILFALAGFFAAKEPQRAFEIMKKAYDPELIYSPEDLDLYGNLLLENKQPDEAMKVAEKLAADYPVPPNVEPGKVSRTVGNAQANAMALRARVLQAKNEAAEGKKILEELKQLYPWSAKVAEADFGIGAGLFEQKKYDEAVDILASVAKKTGAPVSLRAQAMLMLAKSLEAQKNYDEAINNYIKIGAFFESEKEIAAEGLWLGAQLLEQQATGRIPMTPKKSVPKAGAKSDGKPAAKPADAPAAKPAADQKTVQKKA